jgi:hypothetical protein
MYNNFVNCLVLSHLSQETTPMGIVPASNRPTLQSSDSILEDRAADLGFEVEFEQDGIILTDGKRIEVFANPSEAFAFLSRLRRQS